MYDGITGRLGNRSETQTVHDLNIALRAWSFAVNMGYVRHVLFNGID
jgi:hypothetical protein